MYNISVETPNTRFEDLPQQVKKSMFRKKERRLAALFMVILALDFLCFIAIYIEEIFFRFDTPIKLKRISAWYSIS